ncbi:hypothetical protein CK203_027460 [Vitis vinifera]|uniref:Uncharacterized protein n=1 Tax=Vitis vinifera TaxID=29760 RepID=A0A438JBA8_VITVI|nr:hypothetical protein CK203_027460 [Vitis vinifera]
MLGCGKDNICPKGESRSKLQNFVYPAKLLYILNSDSKEGDLKVGEDSQRLLMGVEVEENVDMSPFVFILDILVGEKLEGI